MPPFSMASEHDRDALCLLLREDGYEVARETRNGRDALQTRMYHYEDDQTGPEGYIAGVVATSTPGTPCQVLTVWLHPDGTEDTDSVPVVTLTAETLQEAHRIINEQCTAIAEHWQ